MPPQKALDLFRPGYDMDQRAISVDEQTTYRSRINITFRFYREGELTAALIVSAETVIVRLSPKA